MLGRSLAGHPSRSLTPLEPTTREDPSRRPRALVILDALKTPRSFSEADGAIRSFGMALPEVTEDFPWGHRALKARGKAFAFVALERGTLRLSVKLPDSSTIALSMPFVAPTGYGLGRSGWVTATFDSPSQIPMPVLLSWLEESYRAIAPKRLSRLLSPQTLALEARIDRTPGARSRRPVARRK